MVPTQLVYNVVKPLVKPDGGDRPITLMPMVIRLYFKMRGKETRAWGTSQQKHWDSAVKGPSALRAAMAAKLMDELAPLEGMLRASILWDLGKFYDFIQLDNLTRAALRFEYPACLLRIGLRCYLGPRLFMWQGVAAGWLTPTTSICAGCVRANDMARVIMYDVFEGMHVQDPMAQLCQFVDDVQVGHQSASLVCLIDEAADLAIEFIEAFRRVKLKPSAKKSCVVSSSLEVAQSIAKRTEAATGCGLQVARQAKHLGLQVNAAKGRAPGKGLSAAKKKVAWARRLGRAKKIAWKVYRTAAWQQASYTAAIDGLADSKSSDALRGVPVR